MPLTRILFGLYCRFVFIFYTPLKIIGKEKIPQGTGIILASNHNSHSDTAIIAISSNFGFNRLAMLAASDYWFDNIIRRFLFRIFLNLLPIDRNRSKPSKKISLEKTLHFCRNFLAKPSRGIVMYPEGTRSVTGKLQKIKDGVSLFSVRLNVPIVPIYIKGSFYAWKKGKTFMKPGQLFAEFLDPIYPEKIDEDYYKISSDLEKTPEKISKIKKITSVLYHRLSVAEKKYEKTHY